MPVMGPVRKAFEILCDIAETSYSKKGENDYSHLLLTINNYQAVLDNSEIMYDGRQLRQRFGLGEIDSLTLYDDRIIQCLMTLAERKEGKKEVDGAIIIDGKGKLLLEYGTREIMSSPEMVAKVKGKGRTASGTGRRALQRISAFPNVNGLMMSSNSFEVIQFMKGKRLRLFDPSREIIISGDGEEKVIPYENYEF